jgi:aspartate-semialdehyde dehydrogenase
MKIAIIGATGLVGREVLAVMPDYLDMENVEIMAVASPRSKGKRIDFRGRQLTICLPEEAVEQKPDMAIFSIGSAVSRHYAPLFVDAGITVIDNSSAWRMEASVPLVVPEINASILKKSDKLIANPNCSTIQMVMALAPLHRKYGIKRLVVSTYQSVSGSGLKGVSQLTGEREGKNSEKAYPHPIDLNILPHAGNFMENGYTDEEMKLVNETRKILDAPAIAVTATIARVPVMVGHSESVNIEFLREFDVEEAKSLLQQSSGIVLQDELTNNVYPMPLFAAGKNEVFVGRIRRDESQPRSLNLWIVSDNLRKGAATNAVQIAKYLIDNHLV